MYQQIAANKRRTFLLLFSFIALIWALAYVIAKATGRPGMLFMIGVFSLLYSVFSYFSGAKMAIAVNQAKEIQKRDNPRYYRIVENLAITEGMPMPKVYVMEDPAPNAFATGRDPRHGVVCATTGLLEMMSDQELEGVIAHELGHIKNYDIRVNTIAFALVGIVSMIADFFIHVSFWGGGNRDSNNSLFAIVAIVAVIVAPIAASMIQLSISRKREYLADASGALSTRYPEGLASALEKIGAHGSSLKRQNTSTAHMFFANPLKGKGFTNLFSTHPPIEERIKILREMKL